MHIRKVRECTSVILLYNHENIPFTFFMCSLHWFGFTNIGRTSFAALPLDRFRFWKAWKSWLIFASIGSGHLIKWKAKGLRGCWETSKALHLSLLWNHSTKFMEERYALIWSTDCCFRPFSRKTKQLTNTVQPGHNTDCTRYRKLPSDPFNLMSGIQTSSLIMLAL